MALHEHCNRHLRNQASVTSEVGGVHVIPVDRPHGRERHSVAACHVVRPGACASCLGNAPALSLAVGSARSLVAALFSSAPGVSGAADRRKS